MLLDSHSLRSNIIKMVAKEVGVLSNAELAKIAKDEVNEEPERLAEDLQAVKDWLEKQPHLQNVRKGKLFNLVSRLVKKDENVSFQMHF